jgi:uncharacterized protein YfkK (UPF0435 family)
MVEKKMLELINSLSVAEHEYYDAKENYKMVLANARTSKTDADLKAEGYTNADKRNDYFAILTESERNTMRNKEEKYNYLLRIYDVVKKDPEFGTRFLELVDLNTVKDDSQWVGKLGVGVCAEG